MEKKGRKYVFVLDYTDGRVYRYDVWFDNSEKIVIFFLISNLKLNHMN